MAQLKVAWAWSFVLVAACSCMAAPRKQVRAHGMEWVKARAKPSVPKAKAATRSKERLPGAYYVAGPKPYLLIVAQYDRDIPRKILRIPEGQVSIETMEIARPEEYPEVTSHPISFHLLTIDSPRKVPVLLRIDMGKVGWDLDTYTVINDSRQHFNYGRSREECYGTIWLNGGHNTFQWIRDEGS